LKDQSELEAMLMKMLLAPDTHDCDTENKTLEEAFNFFFMEIQPKFSLMQMH